MSQAVPFKARPRILSSDLTLTVRDNMVRCSSDTDSSEVRSDLSVGRVYAAATVGIATIRLLFQLLTSHSLRVGYKVRQAASGGQVADRNQPSVQR